MDSKLSTNTLLLVIAICLLLIVLKLYDVSFVAKAEAQPDPQVVGIAGCFRSSPLEFCKWVNVQVDGKGHLLLH